MFMDSPASASLVLGYSLYTCLVYSRFGSERTKAENKSSVLDSGRPGLKPRAVWNVSEEVLPL